MDAMLNKQILNQNSIKMNLKSNLKIKICLNIYALQAYMYVHMVAPPWSKRYTAILNQRLLNCTFTFVLQLKICCFPKLFLFLLYQLLIIYYFNSTIIYFIDSFLRIYSVGLSTYIHICM